MSSLRNLGELCSVRRLGLPRSQPICICPIDSPENKSRNDRTQDRCTDVKFLLIQCVFVTASISISFAVRDG